jgi:site-specific recombinase XerD
MKHLTIKSSASNLLLEEFSHLIIVRGFGNGRQTYYESHVREFLNYLECVNIFDVKEIKTLNVINYYEHLRERRNYKREGKLSGITISHQLQAINLFFEYLVESQQLDSSPVKFSKFHLHKYNPRNICTESEIKCMFNSCVSYKEKAILSVAYGCGLRRNEIFLLNINDIHLSQGVIVVREGKLRKSRIVTLAEPVINYLQKYLFHERYKTSNEAAIGTQALFINAHFQRLSGESINNILKSIIKRTQNKKLYRKNITLHCLRHSIATHLLNKGANIEFVQGFLGHTLIDTAHLYSKRRRQKVYRKLLR